MPGFKKCVGVEANGGQKKKLGKNAQNTKSSVINMLKELKCGGGMLDSTYLSFRDFP